MTSPPVSALVGWGRNRGKALITIEADPPPSLKAPLRGQSSLPEDLMLGLARVVMIIDLMRRSA